MKKYITTIPIQANMDAHYYRSINLPDFPHDAPILLPIMAVIYNTAMPGEEIEVISIVTERDTSRHWYEVFQSEVSIWAKRTGVHCSFQAVYKPHGESPNILLKLFSDLLDEIDDGDTFYACVTFGAKPTSFVEIMALNYAYNVKKDVQIGHIIYSWKDLSQESKHKPGELYDMLPLFYMDTIVSKLAALGVRNPKTGLQSLIQTVEDECDAGEGQE